MASFLALYGGDILVCLCLAAGVAQVIRAMVRDRKAGKSGCCGGCGGCSGCSGCASCGACRDCHEARP